MKAFRVCAYDGCVNVDVAGRARALPHRGRLGLRHRVVRHPAQGQREHDGRERRRRAVVLERHADLGRSPSSGGPRHLDHEPGELHG